MTRHKGIANIQGLRGIAALLVVCVHLIGFESKVYGDPLLLGWAGNLGASGVDLFFVISGFIMVVTTWNSPRGTDAAGRFLVRRAARIYPPYLAITLPILALYLYSPGSVNGQQEIRPGIIESLLLLPQDGLPLLLVGWTLTYELFFYLGFALSLLLPRERLPLLLAGWGVVTLGLSLIPTSNAWLEVAQSPLVLEFIIGSLIGWLFLRAPLRAWPLVFAFGVAWLAAGVTVGVLTSTYYHDQHYLRLVALGLPMALIVYGAVGAEPVVNPPRPFITLGDWSYSLYLAHLPALGVFELIALRLPTEGGVVRVLGLVVAMLGCIAAAGAFYHVVERPLVRFFRPRRARLPSETPRGHVPVTPPRS